MDTESTNDTPVRRRGCAGLFFFMMLVLGAGWGAALGGFIWMVNDASDHVAQAFAGFRPKIGSKVFSSDGQLIGEFSIEQRQLVRLCDIPLHVQKAFIATEDNTFYSHKGVRPDAILNALLYKVQTGRTRGGSTITMQVVRNVEPLEVGQERTYTRKLHEAIVSFQVERNFTKDEILELYLNQTFLGISAFGVEAASRQYFGKSVQDLTLGEAATLAGLTRWPNRNNPIRQLEKAKERRDIVLQQMVEEGFITEEQRAAAKAEDLAAEVVGGADNPEKPEPSTLPRQALQAPYFVEEVRKFVDDKYQTKEIFEDGLEIYTTVDMRLQKAAEDTLLTALNVFDEKQKKSLERQGKADEFVPVAGALICIDNRPEYRGFVRAMVGGRDFDREKYNTATQARRQPGSSIKPFVWATAIASGMTPSTIIDDAPFTRVAPNGKVWSPKNFDNSFNGPIPIRHALEKSLNIVSIKLAERVGPPMIRSLLQRCGIRTEVEGLTIALGTPEVRPIDHAVAYSCFVNGGMRHDSVMVTDIRDRDGMQRYDYRDYARMEPAIDPKVAYVALHMMEGVCTPSNKPGWQPTGWRTSKLKRPVAGKTGTTNESRDAWFCGFTKQYTTIVWVGYRDNRSLGHGQDYTGGRLACPIWVDFMAIAHEGLPVEDFDVPYGINFFDINRYTGVAGGDYKEAYIAGTAPPSTFMVTAPEQATEDEGLPLLESL